MKPSFLAIIPLVLSTPGAADCYGDAGRRYDINANLLRSIALVESNADNRAVGRNSDGSYDLCAMQINSRHLPTLARHGITARHLLSPTCTCINVGAWILAEEITRSGKTWLAVARYHSRDRLKGRAYAAKVKRTFINLERINR